jgi:hypothetical protein
MPLTHSIYIPEQSQAPALSAQLEYGFINQSLGPLSGL